MSGSLPADRPDGDNAGSSLPYYQFTPPTEVLPPFPSFANQLMPTAALDALIVGTGARMGWMRGRTCPCTESGDAPGSPLRACNTCGGRGVYWDRIPVDFTGLVTYSHTASSPDDPGSAVDAVAGAASHAEPTITIPSIASTVWSNCGEYDAIVEYDAVRRRQTVLTVGGNATLPYLFNASVSAVVAFDPAALQIADVAPLTVNSPAGAQGWQFQSGAVTLAGYPRGTSYTVEYTSSAVFIAHRRAGGFAHRRPFGMGQSLPIRFHAMDLDVWTRARFAGDGPQGGGTGL